MEILKGSAINGGIVIGRLFDADQADEGNCGIAYANELSPNQVLMLCRTNTEAIVVSHCSENSHAAILARGADLPSLFGIDVSSEWQGRSAIVDGYEGLLILDPDSDTLLRYQARIEAIDREAKALDMYRGKASVTKRGKSIRLCANINKPADLERALANDAEGVFFKTEFLYLDAERAPTEEEQFEVYRAIVLAMGDKPVVIRTADIGADKRAPYLALTDEENPALGLRGIRLSLVRPELFLPQLRAILRASAFGRVSVMFPMVASVNEVIAAKNAVGEAMRSLDKEDTSYDRDIRIGIMIETPAAAILSKELAGQVDFFSIGTNDLIQYTLAADRQNPWVKEVYDPYHPAVLSLVRYAVENAVLAGIEVGISGELGADFSLTKTLISYGMQTFALPCAKILEMRKHISEIE